MIYHTLFVLEQKEMKANETEIHLYGKDDAWKDKAEFDRLTGTESRIDANPEKAMDFMLAKQLLCV